MKINELNNNIISIELDVPFSQLKKDSSFYMESQNSELEELTLDIQKNGIIKRLEVSIQDGYFVIKDGNRRYDAIHQLIDNGSSNPKIPVIIYVKQLDRNVI